MTTNRKISIVNLVIYLVLFVLDIIFIGSLKDEILAIIEQSVGGGNENYIGLLAGVPVLMAILYLIFCGITVTVNILLKIFQICFDKWGFSVPSIVMNCITAIWTGIMGISYLSGNVENIAFICLGALLIEIAALVLECISVAKGKRKVVDAVKPKIENAIKSRKEAPAANSGKIKKLTIPGLVINALMALSSGACFAWLWKSFLEGEAFAGMGSFEGLGMYSMLIAGIIGAAILMIFATVILIFLCSLLSTIMKIFSVATGKGGFIIPCLVFEGALLLVEGLWFLGGLSTGIIAVLFAVPLALSIVSFVFNVKVLKARGELLRAAEAEAEKSSA